MTKQFVRRGILNCLIKEELCELIEERSNTFLEIWIVKYD